MRGPLDQMLGFAMKVVKTASERPKAFACVSVLIATFFIANPASARMGDSCESMQLTPSLVIEECQGGAANEVLVRLIFTEYASAKAINVVYRNGLNKNDPRFDRLWIVGESDTLTAEEQGQLKSAARTTNLDLRDRLRQDGLIPLLALLTEMIEPGDKIEPFDRLGSAIETRSITRICDFRGKEKNGWYHADGADVESTVMVGLDESHCYGRCGAGCGRRQQYTQECLNHDICHRETGQNLGVCKEEFWGAADGFLFATDC